MLIRLIIKHCKDSLYSGKTRSKNTKKCFILAKYQLKATLLLTYTPHQTIKLSY